LLVQDERQGIGFTLGTCNISSFIYNHLRI
jgi:hypothetical protein